MDRSKFLDRDSRYKNYVKRGVTEMRPFEEGEVLNNVSISDEALFNGSPRVGDMIARNPKNINDRWLVESDYFREHYVKE